MALTQSHYRFGVVELAEATHGWHADEDAPTDRVAGAGGQFLCRVCVQADAALTNNLVLTWQRRQSRAGAVVSDWANVTTASSVLRTGASTVFADGANCTKRLSGTGTFVAGNAGCTADGSAGGATNDVAASGCTESEIGVQLIAADVQVGDLIELRVVQGTATLLAAYAATPSLTVAFEVFPVATRNAGVTDNQASPTVVPAGAAGKKYFVHLTGLSQADLADATVAFELAMYVQNPDLTWPPMSNAYAACAFQGPVTGKGGHMAPPPGPGTVDGNDLAGRTVYFRLNNTGRAFDAGLAAAQV